VPIHARKDAWTGRLAGGGVQVDDAIGDVERSMIMASKRIWTAVMMQALVLIGVGSAVGVVDSMRRPIKLSRETMDVRELLAPKSTGATASPVTPAPVDPKAGTSGAMSTSPTAPTPGPTTAATAKPGETGWQPTAKSAMPAGQITIDEAKALFDQGATFVDTRKSDEYRAGHVKDAYRISLSNFKSGDPALLQMIPRDSIVVCYCIGGHCDESEAVAKMFSGSGYSKVFVMHDGYPGWKVMGHPVQTGEGIEAE
jgi:rhodanese-related sulfurtransferase